MNYKELTHLGLSEKEAKVYLSALELGKSSVQKIASKAEVNRATTYVVIEALVKKGLMSSIEENKKQYFYAEPPEKLRMLFESMETEIVRKLDYLDKMLPELKALHQTQKEKPFVRYFEGKEGIRAMSEEFFLDKNVGEARMVCCLSLLLDALAKDEHSGLKAAMPDKRVRVILNSERKSSNAINHDSRTVPVKNFPITSDIIFFKNKVGIAGQEGKIAGLIIENKEICSTFKTLFDLAWEYLGSEKDQGE
jgi:sugar-specific transcriptional regulator TrmB